MRSVSAIIKRFLLEHAAPFSLSVKIVIPCNLTTRNRVRTCQKYTVPGSEQQDKVDRQARSQVRSIWWKFGQE